MKRKYLFWFYRKLCSENKFHSTDFFFVSEFPRFAHSNSINQPKPLNMTNTATNTKLSQVEVAERYEPLLAIFANITFDSHMSTEPGIVKLHKTIGNQLSRMPDDEVDVGFGDCDLDGPSSSSRLDVRWRRAAVVDGIMCVCVCNMPTNRHNLWVIRKDDQLDRVSIILNSALSHKNEPDKTKHKIKHRSADVVSLYSVFTFHVIHQIHQPTKESGHNSRTA